MTNILIIEDDESLNNYLQELLKLKGFTPFSAANGTEGLKIYLENNINLIITDVLMPEKDGIEVILKVRESGQKVPIIAMSGGGNTYSMNNLGYAEKLGADCVLAKPFGKQELLDKINYFLATDQ